MLGPEPSSCGSTTQPGTEYWIQTCAQRSSSRGPLTTPILWLAFLAALNAPASYARRPRRAARWVGCQPCSNLVAYRRRTSLITEHRTGQERRPVERGYPGSIDDRTVYRYRGGPNEPAGHEV